MGASGDAVPMVTVRQLRDGALAAMGRGDESALNKCCAGLMSQRGRLAVEVIDAVSSLAMAMALSGGTTCARLAQLLCDFVGSAGSPRQQLALSRKMYAASSEADSSASSELYAASPTVATSAQSTFKAPWQTWLPCSPPSLPASYVIIPMGMHHFQLHAMTNRTSRRQRMWMTHQQTN